MASDYLAREIANPKIVGLITVTRTELAEDFKNVTILLSVLPHSKEGEALRFVKRARSDFRDFVKKRSFLRPVPTIDFEIDYGELNRQRVDELTMK